MGHDRSGVLLCVVPGWSQPSSVHHPSAPAPLAGDREMAISALSARIPPCLHGALTQVLLGVKLMAVLLCPFPGVRGVCFDKKAALHGGLPIVG